MTAESTLWSVPPRRSLRAAAERGPSLAERLSDGILRLSPGVLLPRLAARDRFPARLLGLPRDPVAGDRAAGEALLVGRMTHGGHTARLAGFDWAAPMPPGFAAHADSFAWVRDLAATGSPRAAAIVQPLLASWLAAHPRRPAPAAPDRTGARLLVWTLNWGLLNDRAEPTVRSALLTAYARTARHLATMIPRAAEGLPRLRAAAGAVAGGLSLAGADAALAQAETAFRAALRSFAGEGGAVASRAPLDQLDLVELLCALAAVYIARARPDPSADIVLRAASVLAGMTRTDGGLAAFHGAGGAQRRVRHALALVAPTERRPEPGYERVEAGDSVLVLDAGPPPEQRASIGCHASTLSFDFGQAGERLVVNCGGARGVAAALDPALAAALRTTAAHSTLVVADHNSTRLRDDGCLGRGVSEVTVRRDRSDEGHLVEACHDGYRRRFGLDHRRRLFLSACGRDLRGEDELIARGNAPVRAHFALRFHLDHTVVADAAANEVMAATPSGAIWSFRCREARPLLEDSVVLCDEGVPRRARQIVVTGHGPSLTAWSFRRIA